MEGEGRAVTRDFKHSFKAPERAELPLVVYNAGFQKCPPGYGWGPGIRDHYLIHYIVSGRGTYETAGRTFVPEAGEAFLVRPEEPVYYQADEEEPWEYYWVGFSGPSAPLLLAQTAFSGGAPVVQAGQQLRQALLEVYKARGTDYPSAVRMAGYLQAALGLLMDAGPRRGGEALTDYARRGAAYIQRNYSRPMGVEETARYRIQRARELLRHSALPIGAVAASVGFQDPLYFSRAFRRETGESPSAWRSAHGKTKEQGTGQP